MWHFYNRKVYYRKLANNFIQATYYSVAEIYVKNIDRKYGNNTAAINLYS